MTIQVCCPASLLPSFSIMPCPSLTHAHTHTHVHTHTHTHTHKHLLFIPLTDAFDTELMKTTLRAMLDRKTVRVPVYDFRSHSR